MSLILTADNADDFLEQATSLEQVAADNRTVMQTALAAKQKAAQASVAAVSAQQSAATASETAATAKKEADAAAATAATRKTSLDAAAAKYRTLYNRLSAVEQAAMLSMAQASQAAAGIASVEPVGDAAGQKAAAAAITKIGGGYCYACDGPESYDCSGLTKWAWATAGIDIPRVSYEQANYPEVPLDQLQPGDLVTYYSPVSHVAIYVGYGMVVSAADESLGIIYVPVEKGGPNATGHRVPRG
ncbi:hypothetical protein GIS00_25875 [Nakamurella sp. YIM 132087]|uniref:NlpC/P60 domain-containing protein n=2 Tax=Nakamurella alba TaxID=2665158 RepID=A0A7K1FX14_9ACTN|nr:hypothetical protein [Nakamurella alba]